MKLAAPTVPTFYFAGVTTGGSAARRVFPRWMEIIGRPEVALQGVDFPLHDDPAHYRAFVDFLRAEPLALGALVTTHKIDLLAAAHDRFAELSPDAAALGEVSSIACRGGQLFGHATDPNAGGLNLDAITGAGYFGATGAHVLCLGAGGAAAALLLHLLRKADAADRPSRLIVVNRSPERLAVLRRLVEQQPGQLACEFVLNADPHHNDAWLAALPPHSLVINATGLGKDRPGSPLTEAGRFPAQGVAWDLNYRGELLFLQQARAQQAERGVRVEDGWRYFLLGWTQVIRHVLGVAIDDATFAEMAKAAEMLRVT
jgi:shikimate 5-dehydrogenase